MKGGRAKIRQPEQKSGPSFCRGGPLLLWAGKPTLRLYSGRTTLPLEQHARARPLEVWRGELITVCQTGEIRLHHGIEGHSRQLVNIVAKLVMRDMAKILRKMLLGVVCDYL